MGRSGHWLIVIALVAVVAGVFPAHRQVHAQEHDPQAVAQALVDNVLKGDFEAATADFDAAMQAALSADALKQGWQSLEQQVGAFQQQIGVRTQQVQGYTVVVITLQFEKAALDVQVSVDAQGKVGGLHTSPANSATPPPPYELPDYADSTVYEEQDVAVGAGTEWELPGTLTLPVGDGPFPAVVLVHGSGPNDRDETIAGNKPFRDLALGLASQGIAVLRYDKRTLVYGQKMAAMSDLTVQDETISDALAAVALLRETDKIDPARIVVLGHSLGANLAPRIGQQDPSIAGLILMAGNARPLELLVLQQSEYLAGLDGTITPEEHTQLDAVRAQVIATEHAAPGDDPTMLLFSIPPAYWIDLNAYDPVATAQQVTLPMLFLQGERDYQVTLADFVLWQVGLGGRDDVTFTLYPTLNHLFMAGEGMPSPEEYQTQGHVSADVIRDIASWVHGL
jgi:fermentation-respiration switch protein FrsA (DUF1100 family)